MVTAGAAKRVRLTLAMATSALLAIGLCLGAVGAAAATDAPSAAPAKKRACKKKKPKSSAAKKRKGCKKEKKKPGGPTVRASMTWNAPTRDMDLHVFEVGGGHSGVRVTGPSDSIPGTIHSYEVPNGGPETFTDTVSPSTRNLSIYGCLDAAFVLADTVFVTTQVIDPDGSVHTAGSQPFDSTMRWQLIATSPAGQTPVAVPDPSVYCNGLP
jgi:hypothetical protein